MSGTHEIEKAEQQIFGWVAAKRGDTLTQLIRSMGLTYEEWRYLSTNAAVFYLNEAEFSEITEYFAEEERI